jgi:hypothetical protein
MAKKVAAKFVATIELNPEKAGGWLAIVSVQREAGTSINSIQPAEGISEYSSWKNASAAKRWVKSMVLKHTPRKSVKMAPTKVGANEKPTAFAGLLEFKTDAA